MTPLQTDQCTGVRVADIPFDTFTSIHTVQQTQAKTTKCSKTPTFRRHLHAKRRPQWRHTTTMMALEVLPQLLPVKVSEMAAESESLSNL